MSQRREKDRGRVIRRDGGLKEPEVLSMDDIWKGKEIVKAGQSKEVVEKVVKTLEVETKEETVVEAGMPDLTVFGKGKIVTALSEEDVEKAKEQAANWKEFTDKAGEEVGRINVELLVIAKKFSKEDEISPIVREHREKLLQRKKKLLEQVGDNETAQIRMDFRVKMAEIGSMAKHIVAGTYMPTEDKVGEYVLWNYRAGRMKKLSSEEARDARDKRESNLLTWKMQTYRLVPDLVDYEGKPKKAAMSQMRNLLNAFRKKLKEQEKQTALGKVSVVAEKRKAMTTECSKKYTLSDLIGGKVPSMTLLSGKIETYERTGKEGKKYQVDEEEFSVLVRRGGKDNKYNKYLEIVPRQSVGPHREMFVEMNKKDAHLSTRALWDKKFVIRVLDEAMQKKLVVFRAMCKAAIYQEELRRTPRKTVVVAKKVETPVKKAPVKKVVKNITKKVAKKTTKKAVKEVAQKETPKVVESEAEVDLLGTGCLL